MCPIQPKPFEPGNRKRWMGQASQGKAEAHVRLDNWHKMLAQL